MTLLVGEVKEEDGFHGDLVGEVKLSLRFLDNETRVAIVATLDSVSGGVHNFGEKLYKYVSENQTDTL